MRQTLIWAALIILTSSATAGLYGVDEVDFETDLPSEYEGENLEISGFAEGHNLDELRIYRETQGVDEILGDTHCGGANSCSIEVTESFDEGEETFYVWSRAKSSSGSTVTDSSNRQTVDFARNEEDESQIDNVEISPDSDTVVDTGDWQEIEGMAEGKGLESIEIWKREEGQAWEKDTEEICDQEKECSVEKSFRYVDEQSVDFEIVANIEDDSEASDRVTVTWEDDIEDEVNDVRIEPTSDTTVNTGDWQRIQGEATGSNLEQIQIERRTGGGWTVEDEESCSGNNCLITKEYRRTSETSEDFRVKAESAGDEGLSDEITVTWSDEKTCDLDVGSLELEENSIEEGDSTEASIRVDNDGDDQEVRARFYVSGERVSSETSTLESGDSEVFSEEVSPSTSSTIRAEITGIGEPCEERTYESSSFLTVTTKDADANLDVTVRDDDSERLRSARVTALNLEPSDYAVKSVDENVYSERTDADKTGDRKIGFRLDGRDLETYVEYHSGYSQAEWSNLALESSSNDELVYRYELDASDRRQDYTKYSAEQESRISSGEKDVTVRFILNGEEIDSFTAEIDASDDHEFAQIRESGRTTTEGRDTTISTASDLPTYTKYTDRNGETSFDLPEGRYRVTGWKSGYAPDYENINLDSGDSRTLDLTLEKDEERESEDSDSERGDITLEQVSMDSSVCKGDSTRAHIEFKNQGDEDRAFRLSAEGLGSSFDRAYVVEGKEAKTVTYTFSDVQGSGNEKVSFNTGYDSAERTVQVRDCPDQDGVDDVKFRLKPSEVRAGQSVQVSGYVDTQRRQQVDIKIDGLQRTSTHTEPDGFFRGNIRADTVGDKTVEVKSGDKSRTANLRVLPTVSVNSVNAPDRAFEGETFEVCADVESQTTPLVVLKEDEEIIESKNARGNVCFERRTSPGQYDYEIQAFNQGATDSKQRRVRVFESDVETRSFPDQITSVRSGSGMVKVELYNTHDELRRYELELEGLPRDWTSQSRKEVVLDTGERKTEYIYVTPKEEGVFETTLNVRADGDVIYTENVDVRSGGTSERESIWVRLRRWWRYR